MPNISEKEINYYLNNTLQLTDTFCFDCQMCGNCCRKRQEPITMTGFDIYRIAKALDMEPWNVIKKYMQGTMGHISHLPVVYLAERPDGSCKLLHKGRCVVQNSKPIVCALFPLGRLKNDEEMHFSYFLSNSTCIVIQASTKKWTLQEWLDNFGIREYEQESFVWNKFIMDIVNITSKMSISKINNYVIEAMFNAMYTHYDISRDFAVQVEENIKILDNIFRKTYGKSIM